MVIPVATLSPDRPRDDPWIRDAARTLSPPKLALRAGPYPAQAWALAALAAGARAFGGHDALRAGEIPGLLGAHGLPGIDVRRRAVP